MFLFIAEELGAYPVCGNGVSGLLLLDSGVPAASVNDSVPTTFSARLENATKWNGKH